MKNQFLAVCLLIILPFLFPTTFASAADVFYFGNQSDSSNETNASYPLGERVGDLFDLSSGRSMAERSGKISGSILTQVEYDKVSGNASKSFLKNGTDYLTEINLAVQEKLWSNYNLEGQVMMRKTDNPRIEPRRDVRVKEYFMKIANPENLFLFGDFYGELSPFTLGSSLEGLMAEINPNDKISMKYIVARQYDADEAASKYQRNVFGVKWDTFLFQNSEILSNVRLGVQAVTNQDDSSTLSKTSSLTDLRNSVFSFDGDISFTKLFSLNYEFARSFYLADEDSSTIKDQSNGNSFHVAPRLQWGNTILRHVYNYTEPTFYSETGSASPDKIQHQTTLNHRLSKRAAISLMHNYYWDHLRGSSLTKRTVNDEKSISFNFMPFVSRESFRTRLYSALNLKNSDDQANTSESETLTMGFSIGDRWKNADIGMSYEYRQFSNRHDKSTSDYFNRIGLNFSREYMLFTRRLYLSLNPNVDIRRTKVDSNKDVNFNLSFNGQYDATEQIKTRFGYNVILSDNSKPDADFENNKTFLEIDYAMGKKKNVHVVLRGDLNQYLNEDGTLNYDETIGVLKCIFNF